MMKHFVKMMRLLPFFFKGQSIGLSIFLRGRLWLSFRKKRLKLSFGAIRRNTLNKTVSESTGKVFTRYGVFGVKILMSKLDK
jgi:ribosomal protein S3